MAKLSSEKAQTPPVPEIQYYFDEESSSTWWNEFSGYASFAYPKHLQCQKPNFLTLMQFLKTFWCMPLKANLRSEKIQSPPMPEIQ